MQSPGVRKLACAGIPPRLARTLGGTGAFWTQEYFDHMVRSHEEEEPIEEYISANIKVDAASPPRLNRHPSPPR